MFNNRCRFLGQRSITGANIFYDSFPDFAEFGVPFQFARHAVTFLQARQSLCADAGNQIFIRRCFFHGALVLADRRAHLILKINDRANGFQTELDGIHDNVFRNLFSFTFHHDQFYIIRPS